MSVRLEIKNISIALKIHLELFQVLGHDIDPHDERDRGLEWHGHDADGLGVLLVVAAHADAGAVGVEGEDVVGRADLERNLFSKNSLVYL